MTEVSPPLKPLLDVETVAERLGVATRTVRRAIDRNELPFHRVGRLIRISEDDLVSFIASRRRSAK
jgi:excisionase family DNA binding protein